MNSFQKTKKLFYAISSIATLWHYQFVEINFVINFFVLNAFLVYL